MVSRHRISHQSRQDTNIVVHSVNRAAGKPKPAVTVDGAVVERTNHLIHHRIQFDRMLTYRKHVETTAVKCKKIYKSGRLRLQRVLNNATTSYCIKVSRSVSLTTD